MTTPSFEPVARGFYLEALLIDGDAIWYSDVTQGGVRRVGSDQALLPERTMIGGLLLNQDGKVLVAGVGGIAWADPASGETGTLVDGLDGVNEMRSDGRGGMVFGSIDLPAVLRGDRPGPSALYHLAVDRTLTRLTGGLTFANGLAVAGGRLFVNESFSGVRCWEFSPEAGLGERLWALDKPDCDGMALDAAGNPWISGFGSDHLLQLDPDGHELCRLPLPGKACTNVRFAGGALYVTIVDPAGVQALVEGRMPDVENSVLYRAPSPVAGAELEATAFRL